MNINEVHFKFFKNTGVAPQGWVGRAPYGWAKWITDRLGTDIGLENISRLPAAPMCRSDVLEFIKSNDHTTLECCIVILAWGAMDRRHGRMLLGGDRSFLNVADLIRCGKYDRETAYSKLAELRNARRLSGMGPAYFTKLIFFMMPRGEASNPPGYIMDQWTSASVNLLCDERIIKTCLSGNAERVLDSNTSGEYENFCSFIEQLADLMGKRPDIVEEMMFSVGRGRGEWREYVKERRASSRILLKISAFENRRYKELDIKKPTDRFTIRLGHAYYDFGYINPGVSASISLAGHGAAVKVLLGSPAEIVHSSVNRTANGNGSVRIIGNNRQIRDWFQRNFQRGDIVNSEIIDRNTILLKIP